jgi:type II secretory pathway component GspD/PulD (secretin)
VLAALLLLLLLLLVQGGVHGQIDTDARIRLTGEVQLPQLIDLCAERLGLDVEYDAQIVRGAVTLRLEDGVTDEELWSLTNRVLASRGLTTVQRAGERLFSVVDLADAPKAARLEQDVRRPGADAPGYASVVIEARFQPPQTLVDAAQMLLSSGGNVAAIADTRLILLSGLRPRVEAVLAMLDRIDVAAEAPAVVRIPVRFTDATQVATLVTAAVTARNAMAGDKLEGKLSPLPSGIAVILVAPPTEIAQWYPLIETFDVPQEVETRTYGIRQFPIAPVKMLIEEVARDLGPAGSGERWRVVEDELTGALIVSATPREHQSISALLDRLTDEAIETRRALRMYPIQNRKVSEIASLAQELLDAGLLEVSRGPEQASAESLEAGGDAPAPVATEAQPLPDANRRPLLLSADEGTNTIIAMGEPYLLEQLGEVIHTLDVRQPQVMLEVIVVAMTDNDALDFGVELRKFEISGSTIIRLASLFGLGTLPIAPGGDDALPSAGSGFSGVALSPGDFSIVVRALQTISEGRTLNFPKTLVNNNETAALDSVLQAPTTSVNASNTVSTTSFAGFQDAGTSITVTPQIAAGDHLILEYTVGLSAFVGDSADPSVPPPRQQNTLNSTVTIPDGYTIVLGGLEADTEAEAKSQVPILGDIPIIGELFKSTSISKQKSRFFVFIQANVLRNDGFEDLKYLSDVDMTAVGVDDGWPTPEPRIIK